MLVMIIIILFKDGICDENSSVFNDDNGNENERRKINQKKKKKHFHSSRIESEDEEESSAKLNPSSIANGLVTIVVAASAEQFLCGEPDEDLTRSQKSIMYMNQDHTPLQNENKEDKIKDGNEMEIDDTIKHFVVSFH